MAYILQYTGENVDSLLTKESDEADYIVATGKTDNWNYRKWNSGYCELFGSHSVTPESSTSHGSGFYSEVITIPVPFKISDGVVVGTPNTNQYVVINANSNYSDQTISFRLWRGFEITSVAISVRFIVMGKWRTT